jgi:hypothetical protein
MANKEGRRRFGNIRQLPSGRSQVRYPGPDGRLRSHPETFARKGDAERALVLVEGQLAQGSWTDPERARVRLAEYAEAWITQRPGLRPRTQEIYRGSLRRHIAPYLGNVPPRSAATWPWLMPSPPWRGGCAPRAWSAWAPAPG